jgi:hypothetical protein
VADADRPTPQIRVAMGHNRPAVSGSATTRRTGRPADPADARLWFIAADPGPVVADADRSEPDMRVAIGHNQARVSASATIRPTSAGTHPA